MKNQNNNNNISLIPILLVNFIGTLGFSVVLPFLVFLVTRFGGNAFLFGITASIYPFFQLIGAPLLGKWSDIYGRKKILLLSQIGTTISWLLFIFAIFLPIIPLYKINIHLRIIFYYYTFNYFNYCKSIGWYYRWKRFSSKCIHCRYY